MAKETYLTKQGMEDLEERLDYLIKVKRAEMAERVKLAREFGDISENAEYDAAKDEQGMVEDEIKKLEYMLSNVVIIEDNKNYKKVTMGCFVKIQDLETNDEYKYQIVGSAEANFIKKKISNESPLGAALLNKKKGDTIIIKAPKGDLSYKIIEIGKE